MFNAYLNNSRIKQKELRIKKNDITKRRSCSKKLIQQFNQRIKSFAEGSQLSSFMSNILNLSKIPRSVSPFENQERNYKKYFKVMSCFNIQNFCNPKEKYFDPQPLNKIFRYSFVNHLPLFKLKYFDDKRRIIEACKDQELISQQNNENYEYGTKYSPSNSKILKEYLIIQNNNKNKNNNKLKQKLNDK